MAAEYVRYQAQDGTVLTAQRMLILISAPNVLKGWCPKLNNYIHGQEVVIIS